MSTQYSSKLLIIEDDPLGRDALDMVLDGNGYELHFAVDGREGLQKAVELVPDLILLDVMMPGMDGYEVCRRIRSHELLAEVPVLMITALDDRASRLAGIDAGADDYINKPIDTVELLARVRGITRLSRYRHLLNERHRFGWILDQANDGYVLLDEGDHILYANPTAQRYFELSPDAADGGKAFLEIVRRRYQCEPASTWEAWALRPYAGEQPLYLIQPQLPSSPAVWLQVSVLDQINAASSRRLVRIQDVSARMGTEQAMWAFQSMVRHKLNTPVHGIAGCIELLTAQPAEELEPQELNELLSWTTEALQRLEKSVAAVLRYAVAPEALQQGEHFEAGRLSHLLTQVAETLALPAIKVLQPPCLSGLLPLSQAALELLFVELLENAQKFHPTHSPSVTVTISPSPLHAGDGVLIEVADDGLTLSPAQLEKIWTPYYQGESNFTGEVPGMGLGLSLIRSLMWRIGGSCSAANRAGGPGIVINLHLPLQRPTPKSQETREDVLLVSATGGGVSSSGEPG